MLFTRRKRLSRLDTYSKTLFNSSALQDCPDLFCARPVLNVNERHTLCYFENKTTHTDTLRRMKSVHTRVRAINVLAKTYSRRFPYEPRREFSVRNVYYFLCKA